MMKELEIVRDEFGDETPYMIERSETDPSYIIAYIDDENGLEQIARVRKHRNTWAPWCNLDNGVSYDSLSYLCEKALQA